MNDRSEYQGLGLAVASLNGSLSTRGRILGPDHPQALAARNNLDGVRRFVAEAARSSDAGDGAPRPPDVPRSDLR